MRFVGLIIALVLALGAGLVAWKLAGGAQQPMGQVLANPSQPDFQTVDVLVAVKPIPLGEKIEASMLDTQQWPSHLVVDGFVTTADQSKKIVGMVTRAPFQEREPILMSKLANPDDPSFLAAGLPKGKKVVTISTDAIAGLAGFAYPGDRVDVLVTHPVPNPDAPEGATGKLAEETVTETLLSNIKVLAVDQRATGVSDPKEKKVMPSSVSLEVTLDQAQKLRLAQETGYLSMTLRSLHDKDTVDTGFVTHVKDVTLTNAYDGAEKKDKKDAIMVIRGTKAEELKVSTPSSVKGGADALQSAKPVDVSSGAASGSEPKVK